MFTTECFIRKNTKRLQKQLENIGYHICICAKWGDSIWLDNLIMNGTIHGIGYFDSYITNITSQSEALKEFELTTTKIDCGKNEQLFLALCSLRDDTDKYQWFTDGTLWERCESDLPSKYMQMHGHKASVEEIINYFKK